MDAIYSSLPLTAPNTIRVLGILPGEENSPVITKLRVTVVNDSDLPYDALSYYWGSPENPESVLCNGESIAVTRNLYSYLNQCRSNIAPDKIHWIWIDAICINQSSLDERASQVQIMQNIYKSAREVHVYLGDEPDDVGLLFDLMHRLEKLLTDHYNDKEQFYYTDFESLGLPKAGSRSWEVWQEILARPYFTRAWVVCMQISLCF
jgi:hypothetical protein